MIICVLEVDSNRHLFTRHILHMNQNSKEYMAKKIVMTIQVMLNKKMNDPIMMKNKEDLRTDNKGTEVETTVVEREAKLKNSKKKKEANRFTPHQ